MEYVATIGMFDGVHKGHQFVLRHVVDEARRRGLQSLAITLDGTSVLSRKPVLTPLDEKLLLLSKTGIDRTEVLPFTDDLRQLTARQFMHDVLKRQLHVRVLLTGYDNRFGHNREETFEDYVRYGQELGIDVVRLPAHGVVSSSLIRQQLQQGSVAEAADLLGYPYTVMGRVEHGEHIGTTLGFPTANVVPHDRRQLIPAPGVYAVKVRIGDGGELRNGMMNIGRRPTFDGHQTTLEVHVFRLHEDLYGQQLSVLFCHRLRDERRFDSPEALREQLEKDAIQAESIL